MQIQRIVLPNNRESWLVIDNHFEPIEPITEFIRYLVNTEKSPNTIRSYANHLRLYWDFLDTQQLDWLTVTITHFGAFVHWLRNPDLNVIPLLNQNAWHDEASVNTILSVISSFYRFHQQCGRTTISLTQLVSAGRRKAYSLLHHLFKRYPQHRKIIKLRTKTTVPKTISANEVKQLIALCDNIKARFLVTLLAETGLRIGQLLGLQHQDIKSWDNVIHIIPRVTNGIDAQAKRKHLHVVHVPPSLMQLYGDYSLSYCEFANPDDWVFTQRDGKARLTYSTVKQLFNRLSKKLDKKVTPHVLRHTHATALLRAGWEPAYVQKRLGHAHIQTTLDIYSHLNMDDLKQTYKRYLENRNKGDLQ